MVFYLNVWKILS